LNIGITCQERSSPNDPIGDIKGPVLDNTCNHICVTCEQYLLEGITLKYALANGLWLNVVPQQLQNLTFAEQMLIACVHYNKCIVRVSSGMHKMKSNVIIYHNPTPKIYQTLPPPIEEFDDVLAFIFTGPVQPTSKDLQHTPLLVQRHRVTVALEWLKLNHVDYDDVNISYKNLNQYPENGVPVVVAYCKIDTNQDILSVSSFDNDEEDSVEDRPCPFVVNGILGDQPEINSPKVLIARATKHLMQDNGGVLAISHA
jgi:hypothetical protein